MMVLLQVSILLWLTLIVTLSSYKPLFYQMKLTQNNIKARQQHWRAEGGVECLYAYIQAMEHSIQVNSDKVSLLENSAITRLIYGSVNYDPTLFESECRQILNLSQAFLIALPSASSDALYYQIHVRADYAQIQKNIQLQAVATNNNDYKGIVVMQKGSWYAL